MVLRRLTYCGLLFMLLSCSGTSIEPTGSTAQRATGVYPTNRFFGTIGFTNSVLRPLLTAGIGTWWCGDAAISTSVPGLSAYGNAPPNTGDALACDYELSAQTDTGGITYDVYASRAGFPFPTQTGQVLLPKPDPGTQVNFSACAGVGSLEFHDACNGGAVIDPGNVNLFGVPSFKLGTTYYALLQDGQDVDVTVTYTLGSDPDVDLLHFSDVVSMHGACDATDPHVVDVCSDIGGIQLGNLNGPYDVVGETEQFALVVNAFNGPSGNARSFHDYVAPFERPVSTPSEWWTLVNMYPGHYYGLNAIGGFRTGTDYTYFEARPVDAGDVVANTTTTVMASGLYPFVMHPAFFSGSIELVNPSLPDATGTASWAHLYRQPLDGSGIPSGGRPDPGTATQAGDGAGGYVTSSFSGDFDATVHRLLSAYELPVVSTYDAPTNWYRNLKLTFSSPFDATNPSDYRSGNLYLVQNVPANPTLLNAGDSATVNYKACFNEVQFDLVIIGGDTLFNPSLDLAGGFNGTTALDGSTLNYSASGNFSGYPVSPSSAVGHVLFPLPEGTYTLTPHANVLTSTGTQSYTTFSNVDVTVGCGEKRVLNQFLSVTAQTATGTDCATFPDTHLSVNVSSSGFAVNHVWYTVNSDATVHDICASSCGVSPSYADVAIPSSLLGACNNTITVYATSAEIPDLSASIGKVLINEVPGDGIDCGHPECGTEPPVGPACVYGKQGVDIRDRTVVQADVDAGALTLGVQARIQGNADVDGNAQLSNYAQVTGTLNVEGNYSPGVGVSVGTLVHPATVSLPALGTKTFSVGSGSQQIPNDAVQPLAPGNYGAMTIRARARVTLTAGTYNFASLVVEPDVVLTFDTSGGPIVLNVQGDVTVNGRVVYQATDPSKISLYSNGALVQFYANPNSSYAAFPGSIVAPNAQIHIYSKVSINGCVQGRTVILEPDDRVVGGVPPILPGTPSCTDGIQNGTETGVDCGGSCTAKCPNGSGCTTGADCQSGVCTGGMCVAPGQQFTAQLSLTSNWDTGYCAEVKVTNNGTAPISTWTVVLDLHQSVPSTTWNGSFAASGSTYTVTPLSYNASLTPGGSTTFGLCANKTVPNNVWIPPTVILP